MTTLLEIEENIFLFKMNFNIEMTVDKKNITRLYISKMHWLLVMSHCAQCLERVFLTLCQLRERVIFKGDHTNLYKT